MKIVRLEIEDDSILSGLDVMALVENPAIEEEFFAFSAEKFAETYNDYPQAAVDAAKQGIKRNEENFNKLIVEDIIKLELQKMSTLVPHYTKDGELYEGPTHRQDDRLMTGAVHTDESEFLYHLEELSLDVSGLPDFLNEPTGKLSVNKEATYGFTAIEDQQMIVGAAMIPGKLIPRKDENGDTYFVYFTKDTIKRIAHKALKDKVIDRVNIEHDNNKFVDGAYLVESWIIEDSNNDKSKLYGFNLPVGTWMVNYKIDNLGVWDGYIKTGLVRGFSIEAFLNEMPVK